MGILADSKFISSYPPGSIWDSDDIGGGFTEEKGDPMTYTTSPGTATAFTFNQPEENLLYAFDGAKIQINSPSGATAPLSYSTDAPTTLITLSSSGLITLHDTGSWKVIITDATGKKWKFIQAPSIYLYSDNIQYTLPEATAWAASVGGRLCTLKEMMQYNTAVWPPRIDRVIGTVLGEWGDFRLNGFHPTNPTTPTTWTTTYYEPTGTYEGALMFGDMQPYNSSESTNKISPNIAILSKAP